MWQAIIPALASLAGPLLAQQGQRETNDVNERLAANANQINVEEAARNRAFQAEQSSAQMAFQERMANTTHQREMADLKAAGINPLMAGKLGGAPAPAGAAAGGDSASANAAHIENPNKGLGQFTSNAIEAAKLYGDLKMQKAQTDYINTQEEVARKGIPESEAKNMGWDAVKEIGRQLKEKLKQYQQDSAEKEQEKKRKQEEERRQWKQAFDAMK